MNKYYFKHLMIFLFVLLDIVHSELKFIKGFNNPNEITDIAEMNDNIVWTTSNCGLSKWDLSTGEVINYNMRNSPLKRDYSRHIAIKNDTIWVTSGKQIFRIVGDEWTLFDWMDVGMPFEFDFDLITFDSFGRIWVSFWYGVAYYDNTSWTYFDESNSTLHPYIVSMEPGPNGDMWFGHTQLWTNNLSQYKVSGDWIPYDGFYYPQQIAVEPDGTAWIRRSGIIAFVLGDTIRIVNGTYAYYDEFENTYFSGIWSIDDGLGLIYGKNIYEKKMGSIEFNKVWSFPNVTPSFSFLHHSYTDNTYFYMSEYFNPLGFVKMSPIHRWNWYQTHKQLDNNKVEGLFLAPDQSVYVGRWEYLYQYKLIDTTLNKIDYTIRYPHVVNDSIFCWSNGNQIQYSNGHSITLNISVWDFNISDDGSIYISDYYKPYYLKEDNLFEIKDCPARPHYICVDNRGFLWVADYNYDGFAKWDGYSWDYYPMGDSRVAQSNIDLFYVDSWGRVWCATNTSWPNYGLSMFDGKNWHIFNQTVGLPTPTIYKMTEDSFGNIWMATGIGLIMYDGISFQVFDNTNTELPTPWIRSLQVDNYGNFYIGSDNGLYILNDQGEFVFEIPEKSYIDSIKVTVDDSHPFLTWYVNSPNNDLLGFHVEKSRYGNKYTRIATIPYRSDISSFSAIDTTTKYGTITYRLVEYDKFGRRWCYNKNTITLDSIFTVELKTPIRYDDENTLSIEWSVSQAGFIDYFNVLIKDSSGFWSFLSKVDGSTDTIYSHSFIVDSLEVDSCKILARSFDDLESVSNTEKIRIKKSLPIQLPDKYAAGYLYPNPTNSEIHIDIYLPKESSVVLSIYNIMGQEVETISFGILAGGTHSLRINLDTFSSGIYFLHFKYPFIKNLKFIVLK